MSEESMFEAQSNHRSRKCKVTNVFDKDIKDVEKYTIIIYLGSEDSKITPQIRKLDSQFNILQNYKDSLKIGTNVLTDVRSGIYLIYGCIVKKRESDPVDFVQFYKCIASINKMNKRLVDRYYYVAMLKENDRHDDLLMNKIVNLMRNCLYDVDILLYPNPLFPKGIRRKRKNQPYQSEHSTFKQRKIEDYLKYGSK